MLVAILGNLGQGKTLTLTYLLLGFKILQHATIVTNYNVKFADIIIDSPDKLSGIRSAKVGLDEIWAWVDSRTTQSNRNKVINSILLSSRKRELDILGTVQNFKQLDPRIRRVTDLIIIPYYYHERKCKIYFYSPNGQLLAIKKFVPEPIFQLYDTNEIVKTKNIFDIIEEIENKELDLILNYETEIVIEYLSTKYGINKTSIRAIVKSLKKKYTNKKCVNKKNKVINL